MNDALSLFLEAADGGAYWVLFLVLLLCGVGLPLPEDIPLIAGGILCARGDMDFVPALVVSIAGVLGGDSIVYLVGKKLGVRALRHGPLIDKLGRRRVRRMRALYRLRGERVVFFARFVAGVRLVAFFLAGALGIRYVRFMLLDFLAALVSVPLWIWLGHWIGTEYGDNVERALEATAPARNAIGAVILIIAVVVIFRWVRLLRRVRATTKVVPVEPPPADAPGS